MKRIQENRKFLAQFTSNLFWNCTPLVIRNFIDLLTSTEYDFRSCKKNDRFYKLYDHDFYKSFDRGLKIPSIVDDIIGPRYTQFLTLKHMLLGNEIFHHVRSSHLWNIVNRFGHTRLHETMVKEGNQMLYRTCLTLR